MFFILSIEFLKFVTVISVVFNCNIFDGVPIIALSASGRFNDKT